jgi:hypothetical protein
MKLGLNLLLALLTWIGSTGAIAAPLETFKFNLFVEIHRCTSSEGYSSCDASLGTGVDLVLPLDHCGTQPSGSYCSGAYETVTQRDGHRVRTSVLVQRFGEGETAQYSLIATVQAEGTDAAAARSIEIEFKNSALTDSVRFRGAEFADAREGENVTYLASVVVGPVGNR